MIFDQIFYFISIIGILGLLSAYASEEIFNWSSAIYNNKYIYASNVVLYIVNQLMVISTLLILKSLGYIEFPNIDSDKALIWCGVIFFIYSIITFIMIHYHDKLSKAINDYNDIPQNIKGIKWKKRLANWSISLVNAMLSLLAYNYTNPLIREHLLDGKAISVIILTILVQITSLIAISKIMSYYESTDKKLQVIILTKELEMIFKSYDSCQISISNVITGYIINSVNDFFIVLIPAKGIVNIPKNQILAIYNKDINLTYIINYFKKYSTNSFFKADKAPLKNIGACNGVEIELDNDIVKIYQFDSEIKYKKALEQHKISSSMPKNRLFVLDSNNKLIIKLFNEIE